MAMIPLKRSAIQYTRIRAMRLLTWHGFSEDNGETCYAGRRVIRHTRKPASP
jgi:hypothetical protein